MLKKTTQFLENSKTLTNMKTWEILIIKIKDSKEVLLMEEEEDQDLMTILRD